MANIKVTVSELQNGATKIMQANEAFIEAANALKAASDALAGTWEGSSQVKFAAGVEKGAAWHKAMSECVMGYAAAMSEAATNYDNADKEAASIIRSK